VEVVQRHEAKVRIGIAQPRQEVANRLRVGIVNRRRRHDGGYIGKEDSGVERLSAIRNEWVQIITREGMVRKDTCPGSCSAIRAAHYEVISHG
jgi:hypothetical protein